VNIVNINSSFGITPGQKSFTEDVLSCADDLNKDTELQCSFDSLAKGIPIFLVNDKTMSKHSREMEDEYGHEKIDNTNPSTDWLGCYQRRSDGFFENTPIIFICPQRIAECVTSYEEFMFLFSKVIVHEFAHAKMDYCEDNIEYGKYDEFFHWIEESTANLLVINAFKAFEKSDRGFNSSIPFKKSFKNDPLDFIMEFIKKQPPAYALGYELQKKGMEEQWINWSNSKYILGRSDRDYEKQNWLAYMKGNYQDIDKREAEGLYVNLFH
jgi:hypothetical protein